MPVRIYLTERIIDGQRYGEEICARSRAEAEQLAMLIGATVLGTSEEQRCCQCGAVLREGSEVKPRLGEDDWPEIVSET